MKREEAERIHEELARDADKYSQRYLDTELAVWGAVLTLNGLIISASSVMTAMMEGHWRIGFLFSITLSLWSSILIFRNMNRRRTVYGYLKLVPSVETILDEGKFQQYLDAGRKVKSHADDYEKQNREDENFAFAGLAVSTLGCLATVYLKFMFL